MLQELEPGESWVKDNLDYMRPCVKTGKPKTEGKGEQVGETEQFSSFAAPCTAGSMNVGTLE